jgi:hypothetical protein
MKKNKNIVANIAETSKVGFAGILAGVFCLIFALVYTLIHYAKGENK